MPWRNRAWPGIDCPVAAVFTLDDLAKFVNSDAVSAHFHQCAHYGAHHIAEKAVGSDSKHPLRALLLPSCVSDLAIIGFHIGVEFAERGEVGERQHSLCRLVHQLEVELIMAVPTESL